MYTKYKANKYKQEYYNHVDIQGMLGSLLLKSLLKGQVCCLHLSNDKIHLYNYMFICDHYICK